jgi:hypothetical protein
MNDLLNNWLVQAVIGNVVCYLLSKAVKSFHKWLNSKSNKITDTPNCYPKYSKKALRKQFYISLCVAITGVPIFFLSTSQFLKYVSSFMMFFGVVLFYFAFECALDSFDDAISDRSKNNS